MDLGNLVNFIKAKNSDLQQVMSDLDEKLMAFNEKVENTALKFDEFGNKFLEMAKSATDSAAQTAEQIDKISRKTGIGREEIQKLSYAASHELVSLEQLEAGLTQLASRANEAAFGMRKDAEVFDTLGIKVTASEGILRATEDVLLDIADKFKNMSSETEKTVYAMDLFGNAGADLVPFLSLGREGITELSDEAERLGIVITTKNIGVLKKYNDAMNGFKAGMTGLKLIIAQELAPILSILAEKFKSVLEFVQGMPEPIKSAVANFLLMAAGVAAIASPLGLIISLLPQLSAGLGMVRTSFTPFLVGGAIITGLMIVLDYFKKARDEAELVKRDVSKVVDLADAEKQLDVINEKLEELNEKQKEQKDTRDKLLKGHWGAAGAGYTARESDEAFAARQKAEREALENQKAAVEERIEVLKEEQEAVDAEQAILEQMRVKRAEMIVGVSSKEDYKNFLQEQVDNEKLSIENRAQIQQELEALKMDSEQRITDNLEDNAKARAEIEKEYQNKLALMGKEGLELELEKLEQQKQAELARAKEVKMDSAGIDVIKNYYEKEKTAKIEEYNNKALEVEKEYQNKIALIGKEGLDLELERLEQQKQAALARVEDAEKNADQIKLITDYYEKEKTAKIEEYNNKALEIEKEYQNKMALIGKEGLELELEKLEQQKQAALARVDDAEKNADQIKLITDYYEKEKTAKIEEYNNKALEVEKEYLNRRALMGKEGLELELERLEQQKQAALARAEKAGMNPDQIKFVGDVWDAEKEAKIEEHNNKALELEADYQNKLSQLRKQELQKELGELKDQKDTLILSETEYQEKVKQIKKEMLDSDLANLQKEKEDTIKAAEKNNMLAAIDDIKKYYEEKEAAIRKSYEESDIEEYRKAKKAEENHFQWQYEQGEISKSDYIEHLRGKLDEAKELYGEWSDEYITKLKEVEELEKQIPNTLLEKLGAFWEKFKDTPIGKVLSSIGQGITNAISSVKVKGEDGEEKSVEHADIIGQLATGNWYGALASTFSKIASESESFGEVISMLSDIIGEILKAMAPSLEAVFEALLPIVPVIGNFLKFLTGPLKVAIQLLEKFVITPLVWLMEKIVQPILNGLIGLWNGIIDALVGIKIFGWRPFGGLANAKITSDTNDNDESSVYDDEETEESVSVNGSQNVDITGKARDLFADLLRPLRDITSMNSYLASIDNNIANFLGVSSSNPMAMEAGAINGGWQVENINVTMQQPKNPISWLKELSDLTDAVLCERGEG